MRKFTKIICLIILLFSFSLAAFSQTQWDTLPWKSYADFRLQPLIKTYVTTGVLYDRIFPIAHMDEHTGLSSTEDTTSSDHFKQGYYEMYNSTYNTSGIYSPDDIDNILDTFSVYNGHPIGILYYKFNSLDTNALQNHLVDTLANGQFTDVAGRPRSPYFNNTAFLASSLIAEGEVYEKGTHTFFLDPRFFLHNTSAHVTQVRIDFGDGQGEWIVNNPFDGGGSFNGINSPTGFGSSITKTIGSTLFGRIIVVLVDALGYTIQYSNPFKITVPGGKGPDDYAPLTACKGGSLPAQRWVITTPQSRLDPINAIYGNPQLSYTRKIKDANGHKITIPAKDTAYFYFAGNGSSCNMSVLHKPIVFIDGFDPTNTRGVKQIYEDYINKQVTRTVNGVPTRVLFGDYMLSQGYDFVILDYKHGNDLMERNALTLVSLLERLYQTYGSTFQQDITLIGPSMGSQVAQYALAYMEHNNIPTHVKTYISFDGPQQGANVPIGLQNMVEYLTKRGLLSKLNSVKSNIRNGLYNGLAARQLLAHHVSANALFPTPDALRTKFLNNLQAVGNYPALCRKVALIDGVSNGIINPDHLIANESLIHIINQRKGWKSLWGLCNANVCKNLDWEIKSTPNIGTAKVDDLWTLNPVINLIFWVPPFETNKYASAAWGNSSQDNAPGGRFEAIFGNQGGNIDQSKLTFDLTEIFYLLTGSKRTTFTQNINSFTFIPSYSSADLRFPTMTDNSSKNLYMNWSNTYLCGHTPFDYVYAPTDVNNEHVAVTQQGSQWFESEVRCVRADLPVLFNPNINGSSTLCSSQNYSVTFCQSGNHTITWLSSNPSIATISGSGDQISLIPHASGTITLTATLSFACSYSTPIVITKSISVGSPAILGTFTNTFDGSIHPLGYYPAVTNAACTGYIINTNMQILGASSVTWTKVSSTGVVNYTQNGNDISFYLFANNQNVLFKLDASNGCGTTTNQFKWLAADCGGGGGGCNGFTVSPNPATNSVNVIVPDIPPPCDVVTSGYSKTASLKRSITEVKIFDNIGNLRKTQKENKTKQASINLTGFKSGVYIIEITDGSYKEKHHIIIQK